MDRIAFDNSDFRDLSLLLSATSLVPPFPSGNGRFFLQSLTLEAPHWLGRPRTDIPVGIVMGIRALIKRTMRLEHHLAVQSLLARSPSSGRPVRVS